MSNEESQIKEVLDKILLSFWGESFNINYKDNAYEDLVNDKKDYFSISYDYEDNISPITFSPSQAVEIWNKYEYILNSKSPRPECVIPLNNGWFFINISGTGFRCANGFAICYSGSMEGFYDLLSAIKDILVIGGYIEEPPTIETLANDIQEIKNSIEDLKRLCMQIKTSRSESIK